MLPLDVIQIIQEINDVLVHRETFITVVARLNSHIKKILRMHMKITYTWDQSYLFVHWTDYHLIIFEYTNRKINTWRSGNGSKYTEWIYKSANSLLDGKWGIGSMWRTFHEKTPEKPTFCVCTLIEYTWKTMFLAYIH